KELEQLPLRIEALETQLAAMTARMAEPGYYQRDAAQVTADNAAMAASQAELDAAYLRWAALEGG
ncbi:MAG TPA: ABC transporter ATP-binding protein, partial [Thermomonas sp.]|nr:ABC transporter ATP-binding protein [Thermomonas sp.]